MKLIKALKIILTAQVLMYLWGIQIIYSTAHDSVDNMYGMAALGPLSVFVLLGVVNIILLVIYFVRLGTKKNVLNKTVIILMAINVLFTLFYSQISDWAQAL